jgi:hypothetical protein
VRHQAGLGVLISNQSTGAILEFAFAPKSFFCFYDMSCFSSENGNFLQFFSQ